MTLAMVLTMTVTALPAYADGDTGTIKVKYNPGIAGLDSTQFKLYKVGHFEVVGDGSTIVLEPDFSGSGAVLNIAKTNDEEAWNEAWLIQAKILGDWVTTAGSGLSTAWEGALDQSDEFQVLEEGGSPKIFEDGVYLLVGKETPEPIGERFWTPAPVLIRVLNDTGEFTFGTNELKMNSRPLVHKHTVLKAWQDDYDNEHRPASVTVGLYNGSKLIDTIEMSDEKGWTYTWYTYEDKDGQWVYTNIDPENPGEGIDTDQLPQEDGSYSLKYGTDNQSWMAQETLPQTYADGEYRYIPIVTTSDDEEENYEILTITNTILIPAKHDPPVLKEVIGDKPKKKDTFEFSLTAISANAPVEKMPMPEGSDGNKKIIKTKDGEEKEFGDIIFRVPGQYIYEIREVNTGKKGYKYDPSVYKLVYDLVEVQTEPGTYELEMTLHIYKNGKEVDISVFKFVNKHSGGPPTGDYTNIVLPAAVFGAALIALILFLIKRRKDNQRG